jgi:protein-L-isoaspartate O-methyltransferase
VSRRQRIFFAVSRDHHQPVKQRQRMNAHPAPLTGSHLAWTHAGKHQPGGSLDFGKLVNHYDAGRIAHAPEFVHRAADRLQIAASARRMEIGAGTGQLTGALLAAGGELVAVEPSGPMAERLRLNRAADVVARRLQIVTQPFETLKSAHSLSLLAPSLSKRATPRPSGP